MGWIIPLKRLPVPTLSVSSFGGEGSPASDDSGNSIFICQPPGKGVPPMLGDQAKPGATMGAKTRTASWLAPSRIRAGGM